MDRHGGPIYGAFRDGAPRRAWPPRSPPGSTRRRHARFFTTSPGFLLAGPGAGRARAAHLLASRTAAIRRSRTSSCGSSPWTPRASAPASAGRCWSGVRGRRGARLSRHREPGQPPLLLELRLRGDRLRRPAPRREDVVYEASLRRWASGSPSSFFSVLFSIWRMRSRVTPNARPTSSSVRALCPREAVAHLDHLALARRQRVERPPHVLAAQVLGRQLERRLRRLVLDEVAQLGVLLLADRLLERHRQLRDAQDVLHLARRPLELGGDLLRASARGRTPERAGARRARPC